jgi:hypothetical protein
MTALKQGPSTPELDKVLQTPKFCTMRGIYGKQTFGKWPSLAQLCHHFEVEHCIQHKATGDSWALALCVAEALKGGVMLV